MKKLLSLALVLVMMLTLVACPGPGPGPGPDPDPTFDLEYAEGTVLRMATGYQKTTQGISFKDASVFNGQDSMVLADGKEYRVGDLKPTWAELSNRLGIDFVDLWTGAGSAEKEFKVWQEKLSTSLPTSTV